MAKIGDLNVGDKVVDKGTTYYGEPIIWVVADKNHDGYPNNSVTLISDKILCLKALDGIEAKNSDTRRRTGGNNHYKNSNILQWLNSDGGDWYTPQHPVDAPPNSNNTSYNPYESEPGFLTGFSADVKAALLETTLKTVRHDLDGGGSENVKSKIFLASTTEVGLADEAGIAEGSKLALFDGNASRKAKPTPEAVSKSNYSPTSFNANDPWYWRLRTPNTSYSYYVRNVHASGALSGGYAYYGSYGVRPLCNILNTCELKPETYKGAYVLNFKTFPFVRYKNKSGTIQNIVAGRINGKEIINIYFKDKSGTIKNVK